MKRALLVLALAALLVMGAHSMALGAAHHATNGFFASSIESGVSDTWFNLEKESPKFLAGGYLEPDYSFIGGMYYRGDQTFAQAIFGEGSSSVTASYLFNNSFFAGLNFQTNSGYEFSYTTLGYRFDLVEDNYIAFSLDYLINDDNSGQEGVYAYDLDVHFYGESWKIIGEVYVSEYPMGSYDGAMIIELAAAYGVGENFVLGFTVNNMKWDGGPSAEITAWGAGLTWTPERWIVDAYFANFEASGMVMLMWNYESDVSVMYQAGEKLYIGMEARKTFDDRYAIKARYALGSGELKAAYFLPRNFFEAGFALAYEMKL